MLHPFIVQALISVLPSVLIVAIFPMMIWELSLPVGYVGLMYLVARCGIVSGSVVTAGIMRRHASFKVGIAAELMNVLIVFIFLSALAFKLAGVLILAAFLKGTQMSVIQTLQFAWLRQLSDQARAPRTLIIVRALGQIGYGFAGLVLLLTSADQDSMSTYLLLDLVTSVVGIYVFWHLRAVPVRSYPQEHIPRWNTIIWMNGPYRSLLIFDGLLAMAMSGMNVMLVTFGERYLNEIGGYHGSLLLYALSYLIITMFLSRVLQGRVNANRMVVGSVVALGFGFGMLGAAGNVSELSNILAVATVFMAYPIIALSMEAKWFEVAPPAIAAGLWAMRMMIISIIWALGEYAYSLTIHGSTIRALLTLVALAVLIMKPFFGRTPMVAEP